MPRSLLALIIAIVLCTPGLPQSDKINRPEQTVFDIEQEDVGAPIVRPVPVPPEVLKLLSLSRRVSGCELPASGLPADWFVASEIHLATPDRADLIVQNRFLKGDRSTENECLFGGNIGPFWIFRKTSTGYTLALDVSSKHLTILNSRTNLYLDLELTAATASQHSVSILRFDGTQYRLSKSTVKPVE